MTGDQVVRCFVYKQMFELSYYEMEFCLRDSISAQRFCRIPLIQKGWSGSTLQKNISQLSVATLEMINDVLVMFAVDSGFETGKSIRTDATPVAAPIHPPTDSSLLLDTVRTLVRLMKQVRKITPSFRFNSQAKRARRLYQKILNTRGKNKRSLYKELVETTRTTLKTARRAVQLVFASVGGSESTLLVELNHYVELAEQVIEQTIRRVFNNEKVPAEEKIVSIFEEHADIIVKDRRDTYYGHKVFFSGGASGLILDCEIPRGNPADSTMATRLMQRVNALVDSPPEDVVFDGGFFSKKNVAKIKAMGIQNVVFSKHRGLEISEMVKETSVYRKLKRFRAGIEGVISFLKRWFGLRRSEDKGWQGFCQYVHRSVIAYNLLVLSRLALKLA